MTFLWLLTNHNKVQWLRFLSLIERFVLNRRLEFRCAVGREGKKWWQIVKIYLLSASKLCLWEASFLFNKSCRMSKSATNIALWWPSHIPDILPYFSVILSKPPWRSFPNKYASPAKGNGHLGPGGNFLLCWYDLIYQRNTINTRNKYNIMVTDVSVS